jgi:hypothetical protein
VAEKGSFISRFFYKVLEIMGAAVATAVSGYLVAHFGGFVPSRTQAPAAPAVVVAPSEHPVAKSVPTNAAAKEPPATLQPSQSAAAPTPALPDADRRAAQTPPDATGAAAQPARKNNNTKTAATPARKSTKPETATAASDAKTSDAKTSDAKPREAEDKDSVEARVKAALANVDANHPPATDASSRRENQSAQPRPVDTAPSTTAAIPPRPLDSPPAASGSAVQPRSADLGAPVQQPMTQPPTPPSPAGQTTAAPPAPVQATPVQPTQPQQPDALTSVEIKSRPVATIDTPPEASEAAPPQEEEKGVLSIFKHILPDLRRPASTDEAPRPPAPVGQ